jgi:3-methyl-2-oxobutanoate hydroxymethyltransferase
MWSYRNSFRLVGRIPFHNSRKTKDSIEIDPQDSLSGSSDCFATTIIPASSNVVDATMRAQALSARGGRALEDIMSLTPIGGRLFDGSGHKITTASLRDQKLHRDPITCITAYDYATARLVDEAGVEMVLVGDSLAQTMLGYENTLSVTMDEMLHHVKAVRRGLKNALLVADMPYGSYQVDTKDAILNAARFVKEGGAEVVKLEGGERRAALIRRIIDAEIPVAGHIGLTPQSVNVMGGYKVQGKDLGGIEQLMRDAVALDRAGVACLYVEGVPREVAAMITAEVGTPTIGIGAGPECDGQVLVFHDLLNLTFGPAAKFVRRYGDAAALVTHAVQAFRADVRSRQYPLDEESYHLPKDTRAALETVLARKRAMGR